MFFATAADMVNAFENDERIDINVKYIRCGFYDIPFINEYYSLNDIPNIGYSSGNSQGLDNYYIVEKAAIPNPDKKILKDGKTVFSVDPWNVDKRENSALIKISLGGLSKSGDCLIHAEISTCSDNDPTNKLMKIFKSQIRKNFIKAHSGWWIGLEAIDKYYNKVRFVSIGAGEPESCDFRFSV
ncbi:MAG: hypothetical protein IJ571_08085 [Ruminococcus sp.]|nr:hypothetical protein [Ruminococcus sp.]